MKRPKQQPEVCFVCAGHPLGVVDRSPKMKRPKSFVISNCCVDKFFAPKCLCVNKCHVGVVFVYLISLDV